MRKYLVTSAAFLAITNIAHADDSLTLHGITLYGTVDVGLAYQTHGAPLNDYSSTGLEYLVSKNADKSIFSLAPNGRSQSKIGLRGNEELVDGWYGLFKLETSFSPTSGQISDGLHSLTQNNGVPLNLQSSNGDSSRAGQPFTGAAYGGITSPGYGTLTFGRQNGLLTDNVVKYDPQNGAYAFSVIGYSGATAGSGDTENARLDRSIRYANTVGPVRMGVQYQFGGGSGSDNSAWEVGLGTDIERASVDVAYVHKKDAIAAASLSAAQVATLPLNSLAGTVSDNESFSIMGMYDFGAPKLYAGYEHIEFSNPSAPLAAGTSDIGGYVLSAVNNTAYTIHKTLQVSWAGLKYSFTPRFDVTGAYYRYDQNSYKGNGCSNRSAPQCSGTLNAASLVLDYRLSKRFDVYGGAMWSGVADGLASGYLHTSTIDPMIGARFSF